MKTHFFSGPDWDDIEQAPCGTWLGEGSELSGAWANVDCCRCHIGREKITGAAEAEDRAIVAQMGDMANFMRSDGEELKRVIEE